MPLSPAVQCAYMDVIENEERFQTDKYRQPLALKPKAASLHVPMTDSWRYDQTCRDGRSFVSIAGHTGTAFWISRRGCMDNNCTYWIRRTVVAGITWKTGAASHGCGLLPNKGIKS